MSARADLPAPVDAALAWTVREGVTNIIRHSHARPCTLSPDNAAHVRWASRSKTTA